jgi:S-DNA-T family DNA segregation ATPase FtsK/SpoIIIE
MGIFSKSASATTKRKSPARYGRRQRAPLLPAAAQSFIARRLTDAAGIFFAGLGLALVLTLGSYNAADPSLNTVATDNPQTHNVFGTAGAYTADVLMQTLGLAAWVFAATFCVWGYRILRRRPLGGVTAKIPLLIAAVLAAAVMCARIEAFEGWGIGAYMGGSLGHMIFNALSGPMQSWLGTMAFTFIALSAALIFAVTWAFTLGVTAGEWAAGLRVARDAVLDFSGTVARLNAWFHDWHARHSAAAPAAARTPMTRRRARLAAAEEDGADDGESDHDEDEGEDEDDEDEDTALRAPVISLPGRKPVIAKRAEKQKPAQKDRAQQSLNLRAPDDEWEIPSLDLLADIPAHAVQNRMDDASLQKNASLLQSTLNDFGVQGDILKVSPGPIVTLYEMEPAPGTKTSRVIGLSDDIARSMSAAAVRVAVVAGKNAIGIELPNAKRETVYLKELLASNDYDRTGAKLPLVLGKNIAGDPVIADLAKMPHLLVAGTTGSGKSVAVNTMILSLLYRLSPEQCRFIMIDPKMLELSVYDDIPHLLTPVVTEAHRAVTALKWAVREMEDRYRAMSKLGVRNIDGFNERIRSARDKGEVLMHKIQTGFDPDTGKPVYEEQPIPLNDLPYIVVIVDEFADLMLVAGKEVENAIQRLAQMARAAGIHLIMATQRPSVDVITGVIKANFPTRISFQVTSKIDSRTILGEGGAETLLGQGDMLYMASGGRIQRVHGPFVSDNEVEKIVSFLKSQGTPAYIDGVTEDEEGGFGGSFGEGGEGSGDDLYDQAVALVLRERKVSTSFIQRHLQIGYNRAARIVERMEKEGLVSAANHVGKREILVDNYGT